MGWLIVLLVVLIIVLLLARSVVVRFEYAEQIRVKISYYFFTVYTYPPKGKKKKAKKRAAKKAAKAENASVNESKPTQEKADTAAETPENAATEQAQSSSPKKTKAKKPKGRKLTLEEIFELVKLVVDSLGKPLKKLLKRVRIYDLDLNIICGGEDAAKAALNYGKTNAAVCPALAYIDTYFTLKKPNINIGVDFQSEDTVTECYFRLELSLLAALAFALTLLGRAVKNYLNRPKAAAAVRKLAK